MVNINKILFFIGFCTMLFGSSLLEQKTEAMSSFCNDLERSIQNNEIDCILIRRRCPTCQIPPLSIKRSFCLFALIDKILGGNGLLEQKELYFLLDNNIFGNDLTDAYDIQDNDEQTIQNTFIENLKHINLENNNPKWTFLVFNEMFFSSQIPLDSEAIKKILYLCYVLTQKHKKLLVCINFLHGFDNDKRPCWLPEDFSLLPLREEYILSDSIKDKILDNGRKNLKYHLANYSLIVWNGEVVSCYRKTTYCEESNVFIEGNPRKNHPSYAYEFGNWESHMPFILSAEASRGLILHHQLSQLFNDNSSTKSIVMRICADTSYMPDIDESEKMLLLTGNGCPYFYGWIHKTSPNLVGYVIDAEKNMPSFRRNSNWYSNDQISGFLSGSNGYNSVLDYLKLINFTCKCDFCTIHRLLDDMSCEVYIGHGEYED